MNTAANGITISGMSAHAVERAIGDGGKRLGVNPAAILESLQHPLKIGEVKFDAMGRPSQRFVGDRGTTAINPASGKIVSVHPTSTTTAKKLSKGSKRS